MMLITIISSIRVNPRLWRRFNLIYQSLYFVPSGAVSEDLVKTSKTLLPSHESEGGSSCIERSPHSVLLVIGSIGMRRRNFSFLPLTSTPATNESRPGE